jgi:hypothetical protein
MLKSIHRKDKITLLVEAESKNLACVVSSSFQNVSFVQMKDVPINHYEVPPTPKNFITISPVELSKIFASLYQTKSNTVQLTCYPQGLVLHALSATGEVLKEYVIGLDEGDEIVTHSIYPSTVKSLTKLNSMCVHGTLISVFFDVDMPIQFKFRIGVFAEYSLLLRNEIE